MKHQRHFEMEALQISELIADLDRIVRLLNNETAAEEERAGVFDLSCAKYPVVARMLAERRDNVAATIAALTRRRTLNAERYGDMDAIKPLRPM